MNYNGETYINPNSASSAYQVGLISENNRIFAEKQNIRDTTNIISTVSILEQNKMLKKQLDIFTEQNELLKSQNTENSNELKKSKRYNAIMLIISIVSMFAAIVSVILSAVL